MNKEVDPEKWVRENIDMIVDVLMRGEDAYIRAMALAVLSEHGKPRDVEEVKREIEEFVED